MTKKIPTDTIFCHDVSKPFPLSDECIDVVITSPPYWGLRDYGDIETIWGGKLDCEHEWREQIQKPKGGKGSVSAKVGANKRDYENMRDHDIITNVCSKCGAWKGQLGLEPHPQMYIDHLVQIFREVKRVLKKSGSFYLNLGDTYWGGGQGRGYGGKNDWKTECGNFYPSIAHGKKSNWLQPKQLMMMPLRVAIALQDDGWILHNDIIWHKPNCMPSSVKDRLNTTYEHVFHFVKYKKYYYDLDEIRVPYKFNRWGGRYKTNVDTIKIKPGDKRAGGQGSLNRMNYDCYPHSGKNPGDTIESWNWRAGMNRDETEIIEIRINLPHQKEFVDYLKPQMKGHEQELDDAFSKTRWAHWIRYDDSGFSFPSIKDWIKLKNLLKLDDTFDLTQTNKKYNAVASNISGKNPGDYWNITTKPFKGAHFAVFPPDLVLQPLKASCPKGGIVLDPFCGRGTVGKVAKEIGLHYILFDIKEEYCEMARLYINEQKIKPHKNQKKLV